jgi:Protein of unknown function (DUF3467)
LLAILEFFMDDAKQSPKPAVASPEQSVPQVNWDQSQMRTEFANVINVFSTREEFSVLFGMNSTISQVGSKGFDVKLSNRIVLTPFAAKRLSALLIERVAEYERRHGALDIGP